MGHDNIIKEYDLYDEISEVPDGELVSMFSRNSLGKDSYNGGVIKNIFQEYSPVLDTNKFYSITSDMMELTLKFNIADKNEGELDLLKIEKSSLIKIIERLMDLNNTNYLVSYLGNLLCRRDTIEE